MADELVYVAARVYAEFAEHATLAEVLAVVARSRNDVDTPKRRGAPRDGRETGRQRLTDRTLGDRVWKLACSPGSP